jgi:uncharacterized protein GlcG (DUF336 family)
MKKGRAMFTSVIAVTLLTVVFVLPAFPLPARAQLMAALKTAVAEENGGFGFNVWATIVDRDGVVNQVVFTGKTRSDQCPGGRVESAQKASTANAFSLPILALSTADLYSPVQPGNSLFGLQFSNPVDTTAAYSGTSAAFGTTSDPLITHKTGGVSVVGGGLALYDMTGKLVGALGVSGDSSCADHNIAWKVRHILGLDYLPAGVSPTQDDNIIYDISNGVSASGWRHPECSAEATQIGINLPTTNPIGIIKP